MKFTFFISLFISSLFLSSNIAHSQSFEWLIKAGGVKSDKSSTIVVDDAGNSYVTGYYNEIADFGPFNTGFSYANSKEVFVAKVDPNGNYLWVRNGTNYYDDRGLGLCLDPQGNVYVTGTVWGGVVWGSLSVYNTSSYTDQIFVLKLDSNGNEIWLKNAGVDAATGFPYNDDHGLDLISDSQGNIFVTGFLSNADVVDHPATFDAIQFNMPAGDSLAFVAKLDNNGNWQWVETFEGIYNHRDNAIGIDDNGDVYVTGGFKGTKTFGSTTITSSGSQDIYVVKYSNNGFFLYVAQAGGILKDRGDAITYGNDGYMYVTGEFRDVCNFGPSLALDNYGGPNGRDVFVAKMTKDGQWVWVNQAGSTKGSDRGTAICANNQGNIFVSGQYRGNASFGGIQVSSGTDTTQVFVAAIDTLGTWRWVLEGGGPDFDRGTYVAVDTSCNLYFTGYFKQSIELGGPGLGALSLTSSGHNDIFISKIKDACFGYSPPTPPEPTPDEEDFTFEPYNVFSPNGDGVNDVLSFANGFNLEGSIVIVNRWGNIVYQSADLAKSWDGKNLIGNPVAEGVYFYKFEYQLKGATEKKNGFITVVR
ncbi:MAG: gliding motility-associated C-terminal domain-containing protein [Fluviicola sp.]|nr:gliding motility-associated C-terminal domain-containing protein [Fluviicola sp.]